MPSCLIGNPLLSGAQIIISGNPWSGNYPTPYASVLFRTPPDASGSIYLSLSGGATLNSGSFFLSGGGSLDGMIVKPGGEYVIPKLAFQVSGFFNVYARHDAACSGVRLFYEIF